MQFYVNHETNQRFMLCCLHFIGIQNLLLGLQNCILLDWFDRWLHIIFYYYAPRHDLKWQGHDKQPLDKFVILR
uniref:Uncharacterized protein n=1 Tax=Arundo donax TaxID=35708 RepID=A0A0A8YEK6_ARUDO